MVAITPAYLLAALTAITVSGLRPATLAESLDMAATIRADVPISPSIPSDFASFCYEVPCVPYLFSEKKGPMPQASALDWPEVPHLGPYAPRPSFINLLKNLHSASQGVKGPNVRIGGDSADRMKFYHLPTHYYTAVTLQDLATYNYAAQWNGTVTIDINILPSDPTNSVEYAVAALELLDPSVIDAFEIGNEPTGFANHGYRPKNFTYEDYNAMFKTYADALQTQGKIKMPRIQGAVFAGTKWNKYLDRYTRQWTTPGKVGENKQNLLTSVSQHHYGQIPYITGWNITMEKMLSQEIAKSVLQWAPYAAFARSRGIPFVIGEGNSCNFAGDASVCNGFGAAMWSIDTMAWSAVSNMTRWNFHGCGTPKNHIPVILNETLDAAVPLPLYYGMWFYTRLAANGAQFVEAFVDHNATGQNVQIWATKASNSGKLRVAILQKTVNGATAVNVTLNLGSSFPAAAGSVIRMVPATGFTEQEDIKFGGLTFAGVTNGVPVGTPTTESVVTNGEGVAMVRVEPFTAVLLEF